MSGPSGLPAGTVGDAVGVLIYTFICLLTDLLLIWLLWVHRERFGYVALIAYFVALCVVSSIIQQIYIYVWYNAVVWTRYEYITANYPNAEVIFKSGNSGFVLVLSNIRFYCYIIESTYLFTYTLHIALSIYGVWTLHRRGERLYVLLSKIVPPITTALTIGLEYTPPVQSSWTAYMIIANFQAVISCTLSIVLIIMILWKFVDTKRLWRNITTGQVLKGSSVGWKSWIKDRWNSRNRSSESEQGPRKWDHTPKSILDNNWLVIRLSIAIVFISGFILATLLVHFSTPDQMAREIMAGAPDLSPNTARGSIIGYIYGVSPGLAIPIVFGLTKPFRQTLYKTFVPRRWTRRKQSNAQQRVGESDLELIGIPVLNAEAPKDSESRIQHTVGSCHPMIPGQSKTQKPNLNLPTDSNEETSCELERGMNQHKQPLVVVKDSLDNNKRSGPVDSTTSFDSLIDWRTEH